MQIRMVLKYMLSFILMLCLHETLCVAGKDSSWQFSLPMAMVFLKNEAEQPYSHASLGLVADLWQWRSGPWFLGPGFGAYFALPKVFGNEAVSVTPYQLCGELRLVGALGVFGQTFGVMPFLALKSQAGASLIKKSVAGNRSVLIYPVYFFGSSLGISNWFGAFGLALSYGLLWGSASLRQELELSLLLQWPVSISDRK